MGNRKGTRDDLSLCKGVCGRMTYASTVQIDDAPEAVMRYKQGYCGQCWDKMQAERPMTPEEVRALEALEVFIGKRRARLARREREREQFRKEPIFGSIEINFAQPIRIPMPEVTDEEPRVPKYRKPRKSGSGRKKTLDYSYEDGTMHFRESVPDSWCYEIKGLDGEVLAKNNYGYRALKHAKLVAKNEAITTLGWDIE